MVFIAATHNKNKAGELSAVLSKLGHSVLSLDEAGLGGIGEPEETGKTFAENARIKAEYVFAACGRPVIADDSGITVDALGGAPGIFSARYLPGSDADRRRKLLDDLKDQLDRKAAFVCAVCCILADATAVETLGVCRGSVTYDERGDGGFGYDAIFMPDGQSRTFGEIAKEEKDRISHRAKALTALAEKLA